jgi:hypothetical protein
MPRPTRWDKLVELHKAVETYLALKKNYEIGALGPLGPSHSEIEIAKLEIADRYLESEGIPTAPEALCR